MQGMQDFRVGELRVFYEIRLISAVFGLPSWRHFPSSAHALPARWERAVVRALAGVRGLS